MTRNSRSQGLVYRAPPRCSPCWGSAATTPPRSKPAGRRSTARPIFGCRSAPMRMASPFSTSSPTGPTCSSAARRAPGSRSCCARSSPASRRRPTPPMSRWCWSTTREARPSTGVASCPMSPVSSPISTQGWPPARCDVWKPSSAAVSRPSGRWERRHGVVSGLRPRAGPDLDPLPRLVVVVDEFASLAADLPEFLDALVGIAQRGRSLGVHLILATQRPGGVVTDDIRANTACRIALRVTDRGDLGGRDRCPGRVDDRPRPAGPSGRSVRSGRAGAVPGCVRDGPLRCPRRHHRAQRGRGGAGRPGGAFGPRAARALCECRPCARGGRRPRSPWPPALSEDLRRDALPSADAGQWWMVDEPDEQRQRLGGWSPADGHLAVIGGPGAGSTTTLAMAALAIPGLPELATGLEPTTC